MTRRKNKEPKIITADVVIEKLVPGGQALGTMNDGKKVFFWNALPEEVVAEFEVIKSKNSYLTAIARKIKNSSPERVDPQDECYLSTSPWQIMSPEYEIEQKIGILQEIWRQHNLNLSNTKIVGFDQVPNENFYHYRNKMEYSLYFDHSDKKIHLAQHRRGSHNKIRVSHSSIERPEIWQYAQGIIRQLNTKGADSRKYQSLLLRCDQNGNISGGLYENYQPHPVFAPLNDILLDNKYTYSPNGFFQINLPIYEAALKEIQKHIDEENVLDLYSGVGTIGLSVARDKNLTLVECDKSAYQELENNSHQAKALNPHIVSVLAKSEDALEYIQNDQVVIVDPPRAGLHIDVVNKLLEVQPQKIIYLSCDPATQARDLSLLSDKYQITHIKPFNFFPRTPHIENLAILKKR